MTQNILTKLLLLTFFPIFVFAEDKEPKTVEVEVKRVLHFSGEKEKKEVLSKEELSNVTYNHDRTLFVGYYQDGWDEMVSIHDAKTKKQLGSVSCGGGIPSIYRFSKDQKFLGAKTGVGWYVWKIPNFEEVFVLGKTDFDKVIKDRQLTKEKKEAE